jgi:hypothetical protein
MNDDEAVDDEAVEPTPARKPIPLRLKVLLGLLAFMGFTFAVNTSHIYALEKELRAIAITKGAELTSGELGVETAFLVTATKEYIVYGKVNGKVEVFVKSARGGNRLTGVDYFFSRDGDEWNQTESAMCTDEQCQIRGAIAFAQK